MSNRWDGWEIIWADDGYVQHCRAVGESGEELDAQTALGRTLPLVLSTQQVNVRAIFDEMTARLKQTGQKAAGRLLLFLSLPLIAFGLATGDWKTPVASISVAA